MKCLVCHQDKGLPSWYIYFYKREGNLIPRRTELLTKALEVIYVCDTCKDVIHKEETLGW